MKETTIIIAFFIIENKLDFTGNIAYFILLFLKMENHLHFYICDVDIFLVAEIASSDGYRLIAWLNLRKYF